MSARLDWRRETDGFTVRAYVGLLRRVKHAQKFHAEYGFHPLYAADKLERMLDELDAAADRARYTITEAGKAYLEGHNHG